ncbi:hypothetical protein PV396_23250 [Streptomyces sp. ME02-8801-2C]|uniref:hypothetical protein n=1 Tax=Streptomyces sp. ME02-8801-2C TaxID=3028680 RepID=UPI0029ACB21E|nr:hypothetical protein [Streptomyces sp. ME02-8801-2C]MDX3454822.1 hypothetical protein [Streptomyces sp. ME02-8801-2C]
MLTLRSGLAGIVDDQQAYQAVLDAICGIDASRADAFRRATRWRVGRMLSESGQAHDVHTDGNGD